MSIFSLPRNNMGIKPLVFHAMFEEKKNQKIFLNASLFKYLKRRKDGIQHVEDKWDYVKKTTNTYEYIHTKVGPNKKHISLLKPLSRAFYKMIEITKTFNILNRYSNQNIKTFHLAEGPGGFIEALVYMRKGNNGIMDEYYGMTLIDENKNVPGWTKADHFLKKNPNVFIEKGIHGTGDLYNQENLAYCCQKYGNSMDIITGDGGFDFSIDYNHQEQHAYKLIFSQIAYAITMQKYNGTFILKIFDTFTKPSVELIYILTNFYMNVHIIKPNTSRIANSEKYIVCTNFKMKNSKNYVDYFKKILKEMNENDEKWISNFSNISIPEFFCNQIKEINVDLGQKQLENINMTLRQIEHSNHSEQQKRKNANIQKCIKWCIKYDIPHKSVELHNVNIFSGATISPMKN